MTHHQHYKLALAAALEKLQAAQEIVELIKRYPELEAHFNNLLEVQKELGKEIDRLKAEFDSHVNIELSEALIGRVDTQRLQR